jgi:hypothetical protein
MAPQTFGGLFEVGDAVVQRSDVPRPLLTDGEGCGVFEVSAADLDDAGPQLGLGIDGGAEVPQCQQRLLADQLVAGKVHRSGKRVVARLAHVDVVVGMDRGLRTERSAD